MRAGKKGVRSLELEFRITNNKKNLTPEQWKEVKKRASVQFSNGAELIIDDYRVNIKIKRIGETKLAYAVFVNGEIKGADCNGESEIAKRFYQEKKRYLWSYREKAHIKKLKKIGMMKEVDPDEYVSSFGPFWNSFSSLKNHLIRKNNSIEFAEAK